MINQLFNQVFVSNRHPMKFIQSENKVVQSESSKLFKVKQK